MSANPNAALDAILQTKHDLGGIDAWPLTVMRYALLEKLKSPFIGLSDSFDIPDIIPSLYVASAEKEQLKNSTLIGIASDSGKADEMILLKIDAMKWAKEKLDNNKAMLLMRHLVSQIKLFNQLSVQDDNEKCIKFSTNGWLTSIVEIAAEHLSQPISAIVEDIPLAQLQLLLLQWHRSQMLSIGKETLTLEDKELIDKMNAREKAEKERQEGKK